MAKNINHVSHIKSKQIVGGKPKLPEASSLIEGEIAINFAKDVETISTKNESGTVVTFSSDNYYTEQKLGSGFTNENSGRTVTDALAEKVDETTYDTFTAQTDASIDDLSGQSETVAAAINYLDENKLDVTAFTPTELMVNITWSELGTLKTNSQLVKGTQYRITDYLTTTVQENTQSANHPFDVIVTALSSNELDENARAIQHEGDTYFANSNLNAWEIKYSLWNDTSRFAWAAESNGKGVIYYMKDEFGNECAYDFKNIQFKRYKITACQKAPSLVGHYAPNFGDITVDTGTTYWCYTFSMINLTENVVDDVSVFQRKYQSSEGIYSLTENNVFRSHTVEDYSGNYELLKLSNNVFVTDTNHAAEGVDGYKSNTFGNECINNTFGNGCVYNTFGNRCDNNIFGDNCNYNSFNNNCSENYFGYECKRNSFGNYCYSNSLDFGCYYNLFGNSCYDNSFGNECYSNSFGNYCYYNSFGNDCYSNSFGNDCYSNSFGNESYDNSFGNECGSISFGDECNSNSFGNNCSENSFGNDCCDNSFGNNCDSNSFGIECYSNSFGNNCDDNLFGDTNDIKSYYRYIIIEDGVGSIHLDRPNDSENYVQNIRICQGLSNETIVADKLNNSYQTVYKHSGSREFILGVAPSATATALWFDDFDMDGYADKDEMAQGYDYENWADLVSQYLNDPSGVGANKYEYSGETIEYDGNTYYLWEGTDNTDDKVKYMVTDTIDYDTLYNNSFEANSDNEYCPYVALLEDDMETYRNSEGSIDWLVKVI